MLEPGALGEEEDLLRAPVVDGKGPTHRPGGDQRGPGGQKHLSAIQRHGAHLLEDSEPTREAWTGPRLERAASVAS
jgi:hypothetical protein